MAAPSGRRGSLDGDDGVVAIAVDDVEGNPALAHGVDGDALRMLDDVAQHDRIATIAAANGDELRTYIVQGASLDSARAHVVGVGAEPERDLDIIRAVAARLTEVQAARLRDDPAVRVYDDREVHTRGTLLGGLDFTGLTVQIGQAKIMYGKFIQTCLDFIIIAWAIFLAVKIINRLKRREEAAPTAPPRQEVLLEEIRDLLKQRR